MWLLDPKKVPLYPMAGFNIERYSYDFLGGGFKYFFMFTPYLGKVPILTSIFFKGVVQPPTR